MSQVLSASGLMGTVHAGPPEPKTSRAEARDIPRDADDGEAPRDRRWIPRLPRVSRRIGLEPQCLTHGIAARPQLTCHGFGHDCHRGARALFVRGEAASAHDTDAEHVEVLRRDELIRDG